MEAAHSRCIEEIGMTSAQHSVGPAPAQAQRSWGAWRVAQLGARLTLIGPAAALGAWLLAKAIAAAL